MDSQQLPAAQGDVIQYRRVCSRKKKMVMTDQTTLFLALPKGKGGSAALPLCLFVSLVRSLSNAWMWWSYQI